MVWLVWQLTGVQSADQAVAVCKHIKTYKARGPDDIQPGVLKPSVYEMVAF